MRSFLVTGCMLLCMAVVMSYSKAKYITTFKSTEGEVKKISRITKNDKELGYHEVYAAVVKFDAEKGNSYEFKDEESKEVPDFMVGEKVAVIYNPSDPYDAVINDFFGIWGSSLVLALLGGLLLAVYKKFEGED